MEQSKQELQVMGVVLGTQHGGSKGTLDDWQAPITSWCFVESPESFLAGPKIFEPSPGQSTLLIARLVQVQKCNKSY